MASFTACIQCIVSLERSRMKTTRLSHVVFETIFQLSQCIMSILRTASSKRDGRSDGRIAWRMDASFDFARSSARIFDPHAVAVVVVLASILPVGSSQAPVNRPRLTPSGQQARAQPATNTHINIRAAAILHQSTWPSNLFFAAPSRATPAGSPAWLPRLRSEHTQPAERDRERQRC